MRASHSSAELACGRPAWFLASSFSRSSRWAAADRRARTAAQRGDATVLEGEGPIARRTGALREAWYASTRRCGVRVWGEDELGPRVVVRPGQSATWSEMAGCYDLLVLTNPRVEPLFEARY